MSSTWQRINKCKLSNEWVSWHRFFRARTELFLGIPEEKESATGTSGAPLLSAFLYVAWPNLCLWALTLPWFLFINSFVLKAYEGHASLEPTLSTNLPQRTQSDSPLTVKKKVKSGSHSVVSDSLQPHRHSPWNSPGQNTGLGSLSLLQGIFPTQGSNPGLLHYRQILYQLSYKGSPRILEWIAYPFSSGSSRLRNQTGVSCIVGRFSTKRAIKEALNSTTALFVVFVCVLVAQLCPTRCNPVTWSPSGSSVHGIFQARILEWAAIS